MQVDCSMQYCDTLLKPAGTEMVNSSPSSFKGNSQGISSFTNRHPKPKERCANIFVVFIIQFAGRNETPIITNCSFILLILILLTGVFQSAVCIKKTQDSVLLYQNKVCLSTQPACVCPLSQGCMAVLTC